MQFPFPFFASARRHAARVAALIAGFGCVVLLGGCPGGSSEPTYDEHARRIVEQMSLREKISQKIVMAFRYWCPDERPECVDGMTVLPPALADTLRRERIGGVILFADNLADIAQTARLTGDLRRTVDPGAAVGLLIGTDQEGGNVYRLPRKVATSFPGNMALGAAYQATRDAGLAYDEGRVLAAELRAVGINVDFAPVLDVNSNPLNPVINVRAYGDDPGAVAVLGMQAARGMAEQGVIGAFKHFPGHGDTATDSHSGLPLVTKSRAQAEAIDLAPYRSAMAAGLAAPLIMTAHIQYPALDASRIATRSGESMVRPATLSRAIQHDLLRTELGYRGVTITDALDMAAIAAAFEPLDATLAAFQAGVDLALMPVTVRTAAHAHRLAELIDALALAAQRGGLDRAELDRSVERIVAMKLRHGVAPHGAKGPAPDPSTIGSPAHRAIEQRITQASITLLRNQGGTVPLGNAPNRRIAILTPWKEQAEAMRQRFTELGYAFVSGAQLDASRWDEHRQAIDAAEMVIVGTMSTGYTPVEPVQSLGLAQAKTPRQAPPDMARGAGSLVFNVDEDQPAPGNGMQGGYGLQANGMTSATPAQLARQAMAYAKASGKRVVHLTLRAPYDAVDFDDIADATLATYAYYGEEDGLRGPSLPAAVDVLAGVLPARGKLPVDIRAQHPDGSLGPLRYARGFGLAY